MLDRFALHYDIEAFNIDGQQLTGRQAAGVGLLRALAQAQGLREIGCLAPQRSHVDACQAALRADGYAGELAWLTPSRPQDLARYGTLYHLGPDIERLAWHRLRVGERSHSLCGIVHGLASHETMRAVASLAVAPGRSWDAIVCPSRVVRDSVRVLIEAQFDYLRARVGATRFELPQLPLIPLGVHCDDLRFGDAERQAARARLGVEPDDVVVLSLGRLSLHAKSHPQQMFTALERADKGGRQVHLVLCGWFAGEAVEAAFHEAAMLLCPSVRLHVLDGREQQHKRAAWASADIFTSLSDTLQETFGLSPLEAMAAGLPCVVSDWNGYRDTVRDGVDGYRIASMMPGPGAGHDLAERYADGVDSVDTYCGHASQAVALDGAGLGQAYGSLIRDASLRRTMGENARTRARQDFDWRAIVMRYRALFDDLAERRRADPMMAPALPPTAPDRLDPFRLFASYATRALSPTSTVELKGDASLALVRQYRELAINRFAAGSMPTLEEFGVIFGAIGPRPMQVDELIDALGPCDRPTLLRGLAWLCKMDMLRITDG